MHARFTRRLLEMKSGADHLRIVGAAYTYSQSVHSTRWYSRVQ